MKMHKIAELNVAVSYQEETLTKQAAAYVTESGENPDIVINLSPDFLLRMQQENPHLSRNECEYIWTGAAFYNGLLNHQGFMLHASAIMYQGQAYLFSAPSGTGKSTHTGLWQKAFGPEAKIINDDKPAIRFTDAGIFVYGTPWSGKTDLNLNVKVPLKAICFLERAEKNFIHRVEPAEAIGLLMNQTIRPSELTQMDKLLACLDKLIPNVPVFRMGCTIGEEAAYMAYEAMSKE